MEQDIPFQMHCECACPKLEDLHWINEASSPQTSKLWTAVALWLTMMFHSDSPWCSTGVPLGMFGQNTFISSILTQEMQHCDLTFFSSKQFQCLIPVARSSCPQSAGSVPCPQSAGHPRCSRRRFEIPTRAGWRYPYCLSKKSKVTFTGRRCCSWGLPNWCTANARWKYAQPIWKPDLGDLDWLTAAPKCCLEYTASWGTHSLELSDSYPSIYGEPWPYFPPANIKGYQGSLPST